MARKWVDGCGVDCKWCEFEFDIFVLSWFLRIFWIVFWLLLHMNVWEMLVKNVYRFLNIHKVRHAINRVFFLSSKIQFKQRLWRIDSLENVHKWRLLGNVHKWPSLGNAHKWRLLRNNHYELTSWKSFIGDVTLETFISDVSWETFILN